MKWKGVLIGMGIIFLIGLAIFIFVRNKEERKISQIEKEKKVEENVQETDGSGEAPVNQAKIKFEGFEQLKEYIGGEQMQQTEEKICEFLSEDASYNRVSVIICKGVAETENRIEFYSVFNEIDGCVLYGMIDKKDDSLLQWTEEISEEEAAEKWAEEQAQPVDTKDWPEEKKLPQEWNYVEPEKGVDPGGTEEKN